MTTWNYTAKSATGQAEVDFVFSDGADFVFSDSTDFVFLEGTSSIVYSYPTKNATSYTNATKN